MMSFVCLLAKVANVVLSGSGLTGDMVVVALLEPSALSNNGIGPNLGGLLSAFSNVAFMSTGIKGSTSNDPWIVRLCPGRMVFGDINR